VPAAAGVDLAGSPRRPSGVAVLRNGVAEAFLVYDSRSLIDSISHARVVAVDAPLTLPRRLRGYREVDLALKRMGYRVLPPLWPHMRLLTARGVVLSALLSEAGIVVIETHPRSALRASGCSDPVSALRRLVASLRSVRMVSRSRHAFDALVCLAVAVAYVRGVAEPVSCSDGTVYLLPKLC